MLYVDYGDDRVDWENLPGAYEGTFSLVLARSLDRGLRFEFGRVVEGGVVPRAGSWPTCRSVRAS